MKSKSILIVFFLFCAVVATAQEQHDYVDLGLPSGTLWATCNVGASNPWDEGDYFAWGETKPKSNYSRSTYKYANGDSNGLTKYCKDPDYGYNGYTDSRTTLELSDDAATANWGSSWCMPTQAQFQELKDSAPGLGLLEMASTATKSRGRMEKRYFSPPLDTNPPHPVATLFSAAATGRRHSAARFRIVPLFR